MKYGIHVNEIWSYYFEIDASSMEDAKTLAKQAIDSGKSNDVLLPDPEFNFVLDMLVSALDDDTESELVVF